jgi:hypothetical protein
MSDCFRRENLAPTNLNVKRRTKPSSAQKKAALSSKNKRRTQKVRIPRVNQPINCHLVDHAPTKSIRQYSREQLIKMGTDPLEIDTTNLPEEQAQHPYYDFISDYCFVGPYLEIDSALLYAHYQVISDGKGDRYLEFMKKMIDLFEITKEFDSRGKVTSVILQGITVNLGQLSK